MTATNILDVTDADFTDAVLGADGVVLVDFSATWCGPCRAQHPILERWSAQNPQVKVVKVDVDQAQRSAAAYGVRSVPTIAVFIDGRPITAAAGVHDARRLDALVKHSLEHAA